MKRTSWKRWTVIAACGIGLCWFIARDWIDRQERRAAAVVVVHELGGQMGGIGYWPLGEEIRVEFHNRDFTEEELRRLSVLNPLADRHWVGVMFKETNLSRQDVLTVRESLPDCVVFRIVDGELQDDSQNKQP